MFRLRVRELRENAGYKSQKALADAFGVAQTTVAGWEGGKREPNYETTIRLANFFGVSLDYLLGLDEKKPETSVTGFLGAPIKLSPDEARLLAAYRRADDRARQTVALALEPYSEAMVPPAQPGAVM